MGFWGGCSDGDCMGRVLMGLETCGSGRVGSAGCVGWVRGGDEFYHSRDSPDLPVLPQERPKAAAAVGTGSRHRCYSWASSPSATLNPGKTPLDLLPYLVLDDISFSLSPFHSPCF
jgi:hypothetical protein